MRRIKEAVIGAGILAFSNWFFYIFWETKHSIKGTPLEAPGKIIFYVSMYIGWFLIFINRLETQGIDPNSKEGLKELIKFFSFFSGILLLAELPFLLGSIRF